MKRIIKIKEYKEGAKIYHCLNCKHNFTIPKDKTSVKCPYCGLTDKEVNTYVIK